jgi:long-chain acyl-CoA synthetase
MEHHLKAAELLRATFAVLPEVIRVQAAELGDKAALFDPHGAITFAELDRMMDRVATTLQREGLASGDVAAICATPSAEYVMAFFGVLRAGAVVAPLAPSSTPTSLAEQLMDSGAKALFLDAGVAAHLEGTPFDPAMARVALDDSNAGKGFKAWIAPEGAKPTAVTIGPDDPFNIIYSSGTTGAPKGIVQSHRQRWGNIQRGGYDADAVTMVSIPPYSNTSLVSLLTTLANGGTVVIMPKFEPGRFLELSQAHRATHAMLVPVQYQRLMDHPDFDRFDLSSYRTKLSTSAPFPAALKRQVLDRWPGGLVEYYGMTEGGGTFRLHCHERPDKLHTVGQPLPGHEIRVIDENGRELAPGEVGEIVGRSTAMMEGYHNQPMKTAQAEWWSPEGLRFLRSGDLGRFDDEGFLVLVGRRKDMIISGGFNIYPSDLEAEIMRHDAVLEAAVVGVPSERWGETPVGFVVLKPGYGLSAGELLAWTNARLGKAQRLAALEIMTELPRSHIGKVLKRELRDGYSGEVGAA